MMKGFKPRSIIDAAANENEDGAEVEEKKPGPKLIRVPPECFKGFEKLDEDEEKETVFR